MVSSGENLKKSAAEKALKLVEDGMVLGLGTGSTVKFFLFGLSEMVKEGIRITGVPTSVETANLAGKLGIRVDENFSGQIDLDVDGADEVDPSGHLIKGGGGALLREKIVAHNSRKVCIIVDESKFKSKIGEFGVPIEVFEFQHANTQKNIEKLGAKCILRKQGEFRTDNGNLVLDCDFGIIENPEKLEILIKTIPGVAEVGLFNGLCHTLLIGTPEGVKRIDIGSA